MENFLERIATLQDYFKVEAKILSLSKKTSNLLHNINSKQTFSATYRILYYQDKEWNGGQFSGNFIFPTLNHY